MDEMAKLIGCQPKLRHYLGSWQQLQVYFLGGTQPLRYRIEGPGAIAGAREIYTQRTGESYSTRAGHWFRGAMLFFLVYPHVLAAGLFLILVTLGHCSIPVSLFLSATFWLAYMTIDLFRFSLALPLLGRECWEAFRNQRDSKPRFTYGAKGSIPGGVAGAAEKVLQNQGL